MEHIQVVEGTYPRDSISLEEWGKSQAKGDGGGANRVAQLFRDPDLQEEYFGFRPLPPLSSLSNQWHFEAKPLDYRSPREGRVGRGWPESAHHGQIPQRSAGVQQASGLPRPTSLGRGGATCCSTWSSTERAEGGRVEANTRK